MNNQIIVRIDSDKKNKLKKKLSKKGQTISWFVTKQIDKLLNTETK